MKNLLDIDLKSRTNMVAILTVIGGAFKMFWPDIAPYDGDPLQLITMGFGMIYLRESVSAE